MIHIAIIMWAALFLLSSGIARAEMWKCIDADGNSRYTNKKSDADANGCKALNLDPG